MNSNSIDTKLLDELDDFLRSSATNVEWMPDRLRDELNVSTGLESVVRAALRQGNSVVIAGTAGSGKTHLLRSVSISSTKYRVVPDLAAEAEKEWKSLFHRPSKVVVAGNEGAFLQGSQKEFEGFDEVVESLHAIQDGKTVSLKGGITVIDAAGFNPAGNRTIAKMLRLKLLRSFVEQRRSEMASLAWEMLQDETVARRLAAVVEDASAASESEGFTFRQLWQFIADLAGRPENDGPWFDRLMDGGSEVALRVREVFDARTVALPHIGNQLWHADLLRLQPAFLPSAVPLLQRLLPQMAASNASAADRLSVFRSLRLLCAFGLSESPLDSHISATSSVWESVRAKNTRALLVAINRYFAFGLCEFGDDLELWLQHDTERRDKKPNVQVSLGVAPSHEFTIVKSNVVANLPDGADQVQGGRLLLRHEKSGALLAITKDLVDGILKTRSHLLRERKDVEYDWRISQFFERVASTSARPDRLKVIRFDFQARTAQLVNWNIADQIRKVAG